MDPFVGEIRLVGFNFAPTGWEFCEGQLLSISENTVLFELIGTTYGGDGVNTFQLPDLRGRAALHQGNGGGSTYVMGEVEGTETVTLTSGQNPAHSHALEASAVLATSATPANNLLAEAPLGLGNVYVPPTATIATGTSTGITGGQPHNNMMPSLTMNYIISLFGIFPSQN